MKIINQCLYNCYDQQLVYTYRDYYGIKVTQPIIPPCQHSHSLPQHSRFQLSTLQYSSSEEGNSPFKQTSWPSYSCPHTLVISCPGVMDPARLCMTPCVGAALCETQVCSPEDQGWTVVVQHFKASPRDLPQLSVWDHLVLQPGRC